MTEILLALVDPATMKLDPAVIPGGMGGGVALNSEPHNMAWHFPGELLVRTGLARITFPAMFGPGGELLRLEVVGFATLLGTVATGTPSDPRVRGRIVVDGATYYTFSIANGGDRFVTISKPALEPLNWGQAISVDITEVPTTAQKAGDLTVQLYYRFV